MKKMRLGEIADVIAGQSPPSKTYNSTKDGLPFFQGKADFQEKHPKIRMWCNSKKRKEAEPGDILISVRAPVGSVNLCDRLSIIGRGLSAIRPRSGIHADYLYYFFKMNEDRVAILGTGSTFKSITQDILKKIEVPVPYQNGSPDLDDQTRIAILLSKVEFLIAGRKKSIADLDELLKNTFLEMFGDPVRNEMGWEKIKIGEIASIRIGPFGSLLHAEDYVKDGIPLINPSNMVDGKIVPDKNLSLSQEKYNELKNYHLERNDVVVARRGEIGRCAIVETDSHLFCGTGSMFVRITKKYYPIFLQFQIYQTSLKDFLESKSKGVTMKNLNSKILSQLKVLKPPLELQTEFVTIVEKVEALKEKYQNSLNDLETLYGALSQKAFKGELDLSRIAISEELKPKDIKMDAPQVRNPDLTVQDESVKTQETREQFLMSGRRTEKTRTIF
jgi:type I restriction enzyme S subunit